jgi:hypothetical protein
VSTNSILNFWQSNLNDFEFNLIRTAIPSNWRPLALAIFYVISDDSVITGVSENFQKWITFDERFTDTFTFIGSYAWEKS